MYDRLSELYNSVEVCCATVLTRHDNGALVPRPQPDSGDRVCTGIARPRSGARGGARGPSRSRGPPAKKPPARPPTGRSSRTRISHISSHHPARDSRNATDARRVDAIPLARRAGSGLWVLSWALTRGLTVHNARPSRSGAHTRPLVAWTSSCTRRTPYGLSLIWA